MVAKPRRGTGKPPSTGRSQKREFKPDALIPIDNGHALPASFLVSAAKTTIDVQEHRYARGKRARDLDRYLAAIKGMIAKLPGPIFFNAEDVELARAFAELQTAVKRVRSALPVVFSLKTHGVKDALNMATTLLHDAGKSHEEIVAELGLEKCESKETTTKRIRRFRRKQRLSKRRP